MAFLFLVAISPIRADDGWKAGTAKAIITPEQPMLMAGYASRDRPAEAKLTDLWAKVLVIEDADGDRAILLTLDLVGINRHLSQSICEQIIERYGFERDDIAICTSHTHTGPVVGHNLAPMHRALAPAPHQKLIDQYAETLTSKVVDAVDKALSDLEPCRLQHGSGTAAFAVNRRNNPADKVPARRTAGTLVGPEDHDVPVLAVRRGSEGNDFKAIVFGYACHATVLSTYQWSGDYPGFAQIEIERLYPGCQAMFWAGCGADQNPLPRRTVELAQHYGRQLANAVDIALMTSQLSPVKPSLETRYAEIDLELDALPTKEALKTTAESGNRFEQSRARLLLAQIEKDQTLESSYPYPIGVWNLGGDIRWIILGGEVVVDYALRLKDQSEGAVWVAAYANDVMAYIPSRRVLREGGYEGATSMVYYGLPTTWAPTIETAILAEATK